MSINNLVSSAEEDKNGDPANIVDVVAQVARAISFGLKELGNGAANTPMGAIEAHGVAIRESADVIASAIDRLAEAILEAKSG